MTFRPLLLLALAPCALAQSLVLRTDNYLAGDIIGITREGGVAVQTAYSPEPINLRLDAIREIILSDELVEDPLQTERLILINGDNLPGNLIALSRDTISYKGAFDQTLTIPRSQLRILRLGVDPESLILPSLEPFANWTGDGVDLWRWEESGGNSSEKSLILSEAGSISQDVGLGQQFIIKFKIQWTDHPDMRINFCENLAEGADRGNRYYLALNSGGLQIRREMGQKGGQNTLFALRNPEAFDDHAVEVELRYNGVAGAMEVVLDGQLVRELSVTIEPPKGSGISIIQNSTERSQSELSEFEISYWDMILPTGDDLEIQDESRDGLIANDGARISGNLVEMRMPPLPVVEREAADGENAEEEEAATELEESEEGTPNIQNGSFILESPLSEQEVVVGYPKARALYFKKQPGDPSEKPLPLPLYEIEVVNNGRLSAEQVTMDDDFLTLTHPILGELQIPKSAVKSLRTLQLAP